MKRGALQFVLLGLASAILLVIQYFYLARGYTSLSSSLNYQLSLDLQQRLERGGYEQQRTLSDKPKQVVLTQEPTLGEVTRELTRNASTQSQTSVKSISEHVKQTPDDSNLTQKQNDTKQPKLHDDNKPQKPDNNNNSQKPDDSNKLQQRKRTVNSPTIDDPVLIPTPLKVIPPQIAVLFPTKFTNTTQLLSPPPSKTLFPVSNSSNLTLETQTDIFQILKRWDKLDLPFYPKIQRLKIEMTNMPKLRRCTPQNIVARYRWKEFVECSSKVREPTPSELEGNHILFTLRTCAKFHKERLPRLFHTWLENVNRSNVVIVTDDVDPVLQYRAAEIGVKYRISVPGYERLCEKAGDEVSLMFLPENQHYQWLCHVDDDMYVNMDRLVDVLANFKHDEPVYFGRAGSYPGKERLVTRNARLGKPGSRYHFAVGGMYCLNRALLNKARRWIGGREAFGTMCKITNEPEDVTLGFVVGILLGLKLWNTELIKSHGLDLSAADSTMLRYQVAISYGFGAVNWMSRPNNAVRVPSALFNLHEDPSQFLSLHCLHHPAIGWCLHKHKSKIEESLPKERPPRNPIKNPPKPRPTRNRLPRRRQ